MTTPFKLAGFAALLALAACGEEKGPGGVTADEESRLDNAASMVDDNGTLALPDDGLRVEGTEAEPDPEEPAQANDAGATKAGNGQ